MIMFNFNAVFATKRINTNAKEYFYEVEKS